MADIVVFLGHLERSGVAGMEKIRGNVWVVAAKGTGRSIDNVVLDLVTSSHFGGVVNALPC
jgi:hypothetical protein